MNALTHKKHLHRPHAHHLSFEQLSFHHHVKFYSAAIAGLLLVSVIAGLAFFYKKPVAQPAKMSVTAVKPAPKPAAPVVFYSPLTGEKVADQAATQKPVTAIMIENSPDARPQSGLKQAGIVYEAIAEGGITRFLTLFQEAKPQLIGPVRSLRMYYVDWLAPYNASVAHVGGSAAALAEIRNGNYRDIDQFFNAGTYWRSADRYAPHNVYTSFEKLDALNASKKYTNSTVSGWPRQDGTPAEIGNATSINVAMSGPLYNSHYDYDKNSNTYVRYQAGGPHVDREAGQITPNVVIALKVNMNHVQEDGYRENIETSGTGEAIIFQNGNAQTVQWRKKDRPSPLEFIDPATNKPIPLNRGQTWISAIPNGSGGVSWQ